MEICVKKLSFSYRNGFQALRNISFSTREGDILAIIGQNGSGKSTLLKCLNRILKTPDGSIEIDGVPLNRFSPGKLSKLIAYIPQSEESVTGLSVFDTVMLGRKPYIRHKPSAEDMNRVVRLLHHLELEGVAMRPISTLSGGQQQRAFIARALAQEPSALLLDEPIANLDINHQMKVMRLLQQLTRKGMTVVITIHDINMAARFCNKALMLKQGCVFASGLQSVYTPENIGNLYDIEVDVLRHREKIWIIPK